MNQPTKQAIVSLINDAITRSNKFITDMMASGQADNPQVLKMVQHAEGNVEALEAVRLALTTGDLCDLKIMAGR